MERVGGRVAVLDHRVLGVGIERELRSCEDHAVHRCDGHIVAELIGERHRTFPLTGRAILRFGLDR